MTAVRDVREVLEQSNVPSDEWDRHVQVLDTALRERGITPSDVLAVSLTDGPLLVVTRTGILAASGRGLFRLRVDVDFAPLSAIEALAPEDGGYKDRAESVLEVKGRSGPLLRLTWTGWQSGGAVTASEATRERDRVLDIALGALRAG